MHWEKFPLAPLAELVAREQAAASVPSRIVAMVHVRDSVRLLPSYFASLNATVDLFVVMDNNSTDGTAAFLDAAERQYPLVRLFFSAEKEVWQEKLMKQILLDTARQHGATHLMFLDADERLTDSLGSGLLRRLGRLLRPGEYLCSPLFTLWQSGSAFRFDGSLFGDVSAACAVGHGAAGRHWL
eukprot:TRINITY_DN4839_c0_g1_i9.p1 TRINITY_DN4839_c0_g1~~TRINITY_DN4839_c0_g1_i9.p1  ORF type:complete len:184 (+),score=47.83 TRINITY_DN4839_c0_g1_i9:283-834(+)